MIKVRTEIARVSEGSLWDVLQIISFSCFRCFFVLLGACRRCQPSVRTEFWRVDDLRDSHEKRVEEIIKRKTFIRDKEWYASDFLAVVQVGGAEALISLDIKTYLEEAES